MTNFSTNPAIKFASHHIASDVSTFDAFSTINRLELLLEDCAEARSILQPTLKEQWQPAFFEFVSFYEVAFVTCLEWHAKSRLYDLFVFDPATITPEDIKQAASNSKIAQMVAAKLTVPHLIVSSFNVSSLERYTQIFDRVLKAIGGSSISRILNDKGDLECSKGEVLSAVYDSRNKLVHEISLGDIGHRNIRVFRSFEEILETGTIVLEVIKAIELEITEHASPDFPNLLDCDGTPRSAIDRLKTEISTIEDAIAMKACLGDTLGDFSIKNWNKVVSNSQQSLEAELDFVDSLELAGSHYFDLRPKLKEQLLRHRLSYLADLQREISPVDDEQEQ